jgi:hypothetical protein
MKISRLSQLVAAAAMAVSAVSAHAVAFGTGLNSIEITTKENQYRSNAACDAAPGTCLGTGSGPSGFQQVNPSLGNNVKTGDLFVGVFASRTVVNNGTTVWGEDNTAAGGIDTFTGYFVQEVKQVDENVVGGTRDRIILGSSAVDPFGILTGGAVAAAFVDNAGLANTPYRLDGSGFTVAQSIASVTDGLLWATFGIGSTALGSDVDNDGYMTTEVDTGIPGSSNNFNGNFYTAWQILSEGLAYNLGLLTGINDPVEDIKGGALPGDFFTTANNNAAGICNEVAGAFACNQIVGNGQLTPNQEVSPWLFTGEDPLQLYQIPEPGTLALVGLALAGAGIGARRRKA